MCFPSRRLLATLSARRTGRRCEMTAMDSFSISASSVTQKGPWASTLLPEALRSIASYESWVMRVCGSEYRASCLRGWDSSAGEGSNIAADWLELAKSLEEHLATSRSLSLQAACRPAPVYTKTPSITDRRHSCRREKARGPSRGTPVAASA